MIYVDFPVPDDEHFRQKMSERSSCRSHAGSIQRTCMDLGATKGTNFFLRKREIFERLQEKERNDLKDDEE